ncbi:hypothetical protein E5163_14315 [Marinicauda algicola]|uniref:STAS/SEC14 domain-containing protein n=1 Tax=Marinicauda algicola TaxID=2029849 RepID=A0A4S2GWZ0_9PROT|nr:hypothetical protein [Marinicauda algicola]TGY87607.1 hypothetical protein E5163_14315 [Marinicauda algicola]
MTISNWAYLDTHTMFIALKGCMTGEEHKETARIMAEIARELPVRQLLVDKSDVGNGEREEEIPSVAESAARTFTGAGLMRIAFLLAHDDPVAAPFSKAFARCGGEARAFDDYDEALGWLGVQPAAAQLRDTAAAR